MWNLLTKIKSLVIIEVCHYQPKKIFLTKCKTINVRFWKLLNKLSFYELYHFNKGLRNQVASKFKNSSDYKEKYLVLAIGFKIVEKSWK